MPATVQAFGISAAGGIIFGLYPAYRAANMGEMNVIRRAVADHIVMLQEALSRPNLQTGQM